MVFIFKPTGIRNTVNEKLFTESIQPKFLMEQLGDQDLRTMIEHSRETGYVTHDLRSPESFEDKGAIKSIRQIDRAFIEAANSLKLPFWMAAAYGESQQALGDTDKLTDIVTVVNRAEGEPKLSFKPDTNIHETALRWFTRRMKAFAESLNADATEKAKSYWEEFGESYSSPSPVGESKKKSEMIERFVEKDNPSPVLNQYLSDVQDLVGQLQKSFFQSTGNRNLAVETGLDLLHQIRDLTSSTLSTLDSSPPEDADLSIEV